MRHAVVRASQLGNRFDAPFHLALAAVRDKVEAARASIPPERAREAVLAMPLPDLGPIMVLSRRHAPKQDEGTVKAIVAEYPHLALVLMQEAATELAVVISARVAREAASLDALRALQAVVPTVPRFEAGKAYPVREPGRYDDEVNEGYDWVAVPEGASPGTCTVHDAWVVNAEGEVHPHMSDCPVPVRLEDVHADRGVRMTVTGLDGPTGP